MADKAFITPNVLRWSRESARISLEIAAAKVNVSIEKITEWEEGLSHPTIRQAEILANAYRRPFALFFLPEIPCDFTPLQDFRRDTAKGLNTGSVFIIREIQQKQAWISDMNQENKEMPLEFVGRFTMDHDPKTIAENILETLGINPANYNTGKPIKEWIDKAESKGIFISRASFIHSRMKLDSDEIQGFAIADKYAPFVFINTEDWEAPQLFTLVHELAHIWIAASGISGDIELSLQNTKLANPIELFCNEIAASALMPQSYINHINSSVFDSASGVFTEAKKLGVSSFAFLVRAFHLQRINITTYKSLKQRADTDFKAYLQHEEEKKARQKEAKGGPNPYLLRLNKNSRLFTQIVLDAFRGGHIPPSQASLLLNTQVNNFPKLEAVLYS